MKKKILIVNPVSLFPTVMMSQRRTLNKIRCLAKDHTVDVVTFCQTNEQVELSIKKFRNICRNFYPLKSINQKDSLFKRKYYGFKYNMFYYLAGIPREYSYYGNRHSLNKIMDIIARNQYDIVQIDYWYQGKLFLKMDGAIFKSIDTHYLVDENIQLHKQKKYSGTFSFFKYRELKKSKILEQRFFKAIDLIIPNSRRGKEILDEKFPSYKSLLIPNGQDVDYFKSYKTSPKKNTLLFYGSMGSKQNVSSFFRLWKNILPLIKREISDIKLLVVGANPPQEICQLHDNKNVIVTGFIEDIREYLGKAMVMVIPMEIGSGFRGRVIEVMAMGVPVVGTPNALNSIEMEDGTHGFIHESDTEIAQSVVRLLTDSKLRAYMSCECKKLVSEKYSFDATFSRLSVFFSSIK